MSFDGLAEIEAPIEFEVLDFAEWGIAAVRVPKTNSLSGLKSHVQLISSVGKLLGQFSNHSRDRLHDASNQIFGRGDLSKEQIREFLLKKQDKENAAEM